MLLYLSNLYEENILEAVKLSKGLQKKMDLFKELYEQQIHET